MKMTKNIKMLYFILCIILLTTNQRDSNAYNVTEISKHYI